MLMLEEVSQSAKHFWSFKSKHCWSRWLWDSKLICKHNIYTHLMLPLQCGFSPAASIKISVWSLILKATLCTNWYFAWFVAPNQKTRNVFSISCIVILPSHRSNIALEQQIQGDPLTRYCTIKMMLKMLFLKMKLLHNVALDLFNPALCIPLYHRIWALFMQVALWGQSIQILLTAQFYGAENHITLWHFSRLYN